MGIAVALGGGAALGWAHIGVLRELKDQVCKLGGDVVWGVEPEPEHVDGRWKYHGRAAHTVQ